MAGYHGTPLAKKLGIKSGTSICVVGAPMDYAQLLAPMPEEVNLLPTLDSSTDIVHLFSTSKAELSRMLEKSLRRLKPDASIWVSWPKKASKVPTDITEDTIRSLAFPLGLVDIKFCAGDEIWSGLKLVLRKEHRSGGARSRKRSK